MKISQNIVKELHKREIFGTLSHQNIGSSLVRNIKLCKKIIGHIKSVDCILFDKSGKYFVTAANDDLIKVWSSVDTRLVATLRGATRPINDIDINFDNTLIAAASGERIIRVWSLQTMEAVAMLNSYKGDITSVNFCPTFFFGIGYLATTSNDSLVVFWPYIKDENHGITFRSNAPTFYEKIRPGRAQMKCSAFSAGGAFMAAGSTDRYVRVYAIFGHEGPQMILESEAHSAEVNLVDWAHHTLQFVSSSTDGTVDIWNFENQEWHSTKLFMMTELEGSRSEPLEESSRTRFKISAICWDASDQWIITGFTNGLLKVWNVQTAKLTQVLRRHRASVTTLKAHPILKNVVLSTANDGLFIVWDVQDQNPMSIFENCCPFYGVKPLNTADWSPNGSSAVVADSDGQITMFSYDYNDASMKKVPRELFFHTDYWPLFRTLNNYVFDEQSRLPPHLMPPPVLVRLDGKPYSLPIQKLVRGRDQSLSDDSNTSSLKLIIDYQELIVSIRQRTLNATDVEQDVNLIFERVNARSCQNHNLVVPELTSLELKVLIEKIHTIMKWELQTWIREMKKNPPPQKPKPKTNPHKRLKTEVGHNYGTRSALRNQVEIDKDEVIESSIVLKKAIQTLMKDACLLVE